MREKALAGTRWILGTVHDGTKTTEADLAFYHTNALSAIQDICATFGLEAVTTYQPDATGTRIATRTLSLVSRRGAATNDGTELLGYARQVVEQADMLEARYEDGGTPQARLAISAQHYAFSVEAFVNVVERCRDSKFEFIMRETTTSQIIDDVRAFRSDIGILYLDDFNARVLQKAFADARASFHPLFDATVHVFVSERHPLARRPQLSLADLTPYTRYSFEQGTSNSFYYAEEPFSYIPCDRNIRISDRGTLTNLLITSNGYTLSTGVLSNEMQWGMASIPLADAPTMHVGYIMHDERKPSPLLQQYLDELNRIIHAN